MDEESLSGIRERALLLLDGHVSRNMSDALQLLQNAGIDLLIFPVHMTHLVQPLNRGPFGELKRFLRTRRGTTQWSELLLNLASGLQISLVPTYVFAGWASSRLVYGDVWSWLDHDDVVESQGKGTRTRLFALQGGEIATSDEVISRLKTWEQGMNHPRITKRRARIPVGKVRST